MEIPLFKLPEDVYRWHSECTYNFTKEELCQEYERFQESSFNLVNAIANEAFYEVVKKTALMMWITFKMTEALELMEVLYSQNPQDSELVYYMAQLCEEIPDLSLAQQYYHHYIFLQPQALPDNNFQIDTWFKQYHAFHPNTIEALTALGNICLETTGNKKKALKLYERTIRIKPDDPFAPHLKAAKIKLELEGHFSNYLRSLERSYTNYQTYLKISYNPQISPCEDLPDLQRWAAKKYPFYVGRVTQSYVNFFYGREYLQVGKKLEEEGRQIENNASFSRKHRDAIAYALKYYVKSRKILESGRDSRQHSYRNCYKFIAERNPSQHEYQAVLVEALLGQAGILSKRRERDQVVKLCEKVLEIDPRNEVALELLKKPSRI
ncbi:tetratricopeptide repeat protein [Oscillatoria sp. FACHB-1406]|uniref:tetratricopeptide repeat protein n=1 Tax=Oscillatoria sp. FACHB-1406 TaxID=2692846 RepID=UPI001684B8B8|nr:tetratricopeptide repeat protein [Oscillatoria sp. FACHB-1406]MBD2578065.1 tetratricopeptide repeat protein [Oscillatoria sp. FACHB-1406]